MYVVTKEGTSQSAFELQQENDQDILLYIAAKQVCGNENGTDDPEGKFKEASTKEA